MRVPTRSAGTRSGVNWSRLNEPPSTSATVLIVSVLARPGTPSSSTWPPARSATSRRSSIPSCPTMTRLTSNSAPSSAACASRAGFSSSPPSSARRRRSSGVTCRIAPCGVPPTLSLLQLLRAGSEPHVDRTLVAAALHRQLDGIAGLVAQHGAGEVLRLLDRRSVDRGDAVTGTEVAVRRGPAGGDRGDHHALLVGSHGAGDAEVGPLDPTALQDLRHDLLDGVGRDREADPARLACGRRDLRVH